jgi:hypothetical protein
MRSGAGLLTSHRRRTQRFENAVLFSAAGRTNRNSSHYVAESVLPYRHRSLQLFPGTPNKAQAWAARADRLAPLVHLHVRREEVRKVLRQRAGNGSIGFHFGCTLLGLLCRVVEYGNDDRQ